MSSFLGIDLGTGSAKAVVVNADGNEVRTAERRYGDSSVNTSEIPSEVWWEAISDAVRSVGADTAIAAIGVTGQMHGVVLCDERGKALRPAITWADSRARAQAAAFDALPPDVLAGLGNPTAPGMAGPLLLWLSAHEAEIYAAARWALQPKDWLRMQLTATAATDPTDASATLLYDIETDRWSHRTIELLGLRADLLAEVQPSSAVAGLLTARTAVELGLTPGIPVAVGAGDAAAALAAGSVSRGETLVNVGSGGQVLSPTDVPYVHPKRLTNAYRGAASRWYAMAALQNAGVALEWVLRALRASWREVYDVALPDTPAGSEGVLFIPHLLGERLPASSSAGGGWVGLRGSHDRRHMLRAALESVAFEIRRAGELLGELELRSDRWWLSGGSTAWPAWRQLLADVLARDLDVLPFASRSARGAAVLAARAADIEMSPEPERREQVHPRQANVQVYHVAYRRYLHLLSERYEEDSAEAHA